MLSLGLFSAMLSAQNVPEGEMLRLNLSLLDAIEKYERLSAVQDAADAAEYMDLFRDRKTKVYNDIPGDFSGTVIPLADYVAKLRGLKNLEVEFRNVEKSRPYVSAGSLCVAVSFDKYISGYDSRGVLYSTEDYYGGPHKVEVVFAYDDFDGKCHVESVSGHVQGGASGHAGPSLVYCADKDLEEIRFRKPEVEARKGYYSEAETYVPEFNALGQTFVPETVLEDDLYYMQDIPGGWDPDVFIRTSVKDDAFLSLKKNKNNFRAQIYNSVAPAGAFVVDGDIDRSYSVGEEMGVEMRYMFNCGKKLNVGIYGALGVSGAYVDIALKDFGYSYTQNKVNYKYDFDVLGQRYLSLDAVLSGGLAFELAMSRRWGLDLALGGKAYYNVYAKSGDLYCSYEVTAKSEASGSGSSGSESSRSVTGHFRKESVVNPGDYTPDLWPCPLSATASVGFNYNLSKSAVFTFGLTYEHGLNYYYQSVLVPYKEYEYPVKYSTLYGVDMIYYSLEESFDIKRKAIWLDLGFVFKF